MLLGVAPAHAQDVSDCGVLFNGIEADRIDSLNSPLELGTDDTLIFTGTDPIGTRTARLRLLLGPITIESNATPYAPPERDFVAALPLDDSSPYAVGLFRVEGTTDNCSSAVWVRLSGRFPLATLAGLVGMGLAFGGATGQLGAIASRRRWARSAAALGGIATGVGLTLVGQEFGRLQLSYPSLAGMSVGAGGVGVILASVLNPTIRDKRRKEVAPLPAAPTEPKTAVGHRIEPTEPAVAPDRHLARDDSETETSPGAPGPATEPLPQPASVDAPHWCYVMAPTDVFDLTDHTRTIAVLEPGNWYLANRVLGGWVQVVAAEGVVGWVAEGAVHRQG